MTFLRRKHPSHEEKVLGGNDRRARAGRINYLVVLADAGTHAMMQRWIPAYAESTPRIEQKSSGGE
jgi:hypothetical protein